MRRFFQILGIVLLTLLVVTIVSSTYLLATRGPKKRAQASMQSSAQVEVTDDKWVVFSPRNIKPTTGVILYPGTLVSPKAYAEPVHAIAAEGYLVAVVPMPMGMAVLGTYRAEAVQEAFPEISNWVVAGHSQGGSYAMRYAIEKTDVVNGLILWAARPIENDDLSGRQLPVLSINASLDSRRSPEILDGIKLRLPADAEHVFIEGGTHEYFGDYVDELDAEIAEKSISHDEQTAIIVQETIEFLARISSAR